MKWFLYAISILWIAVGSCAILYTSKTRSVFEKMVKEIDRRIVAVIPFAVGISLILAAPASRVSWVIRLIGFMGILKGVFIFAAPAGVYDKINHWYLNALSDQTHRLWGIIALIFGTAVLSWIL